MNEKKVRAAQRECDRAREERNRQVYLAALMGATSRELAEWTGVLEYQLTKMIRAGKKSVNR